MNPFRSLREYELFVYTLPQQYPTIHHSTLVVAQRGARLAELTGEIAFSTSITVSLHLSFPLRISTFPS
jgi:hypothetical protein